MAIAHSNNFTLGTLASDFKLLDTVSNEYKTLTDLKGVKGTVIMFICNHCPFVVHINDALVKLAIDYATKGIACIAISSNDAILYPQDSPTFMKELALNFNYPFPYLYDETQVVAKQYNASCTPDFYVFDENLHSTYHGQLDNARPGNGIHATGTDIRNALDKLLACEENLELQKPSIGCGIKWK
jgi:peroxiredoxin